MSALRMAVFLVVVLSLTAGLHYYLWHRLVKTPRWPRPWARVGRVVLIALACSIPLAFIGSVLLPRDAASPIAWLAFVWMGVIFLLIVILVPAELLRLGAGWVASEQLQSDERRTFLSRGVALTVAGVGGGLSAVALAEGLGAVRIERLRVGLRDLPRGLEGFRIAQLTDVHVGPTIGKDFIEEIVRQTNALEPDLVAITGDLVDGSVAELGPLVAPLGGLAARHGVFFVTGNHEYYSGADEWVAFLGELGIRVLRNERVALEHEGETIDVAGVDDWEAFGEGHGRDLAKALEGREEGRKVVLLAHQPRQVEEARELGVDLQLSGHTHGGQIKPFNYLVHLQQPYVRGLHRHGETAIYVSPGTGYWGPPMRLGVPAEISCIELSA